MRRSYFESREDNSKPCPSTLGRHASRRVLSLVAACVLTACTPSDEPLAPAGVTGHARSPIAQLRSTVAPNVPQQPLNPPQAVAAGDPTQENFVFSDEVTGASYTLSVADQEIRHSDGRVLHLDAELTAIALAEFAGTDAADGIAIELPQVIHGCPAGPSSCGNETVAPMVAPTDRGSRKALRFLWDDRSTRPRRRLSATSNTKWPVIFEKSSGEGLWGGGMSSYSISPLVQGYSFTCQDVADVVVSQVEAYRGRRASWLRDTFDNAVNTVLDRFSPQGLVFFEDAVDRAYARISLGVLNAVWNTLGCPPRGVTAHEILRTGTGGSIPGILEKVCHREDWRISFDGGNTWTWIGVDVCMYRNMD